MCDGDFTCNCSDIDSDSYATLNNTIGTANKPATLTFRYTKTTD